jgi:[ribosomal protein S5]-alanine N-acetyltransferase
MAWRDARFFCRLARDPELRRFLGGPVHWTRLLPRVLRYMARDAGSGIWIATVAGTGTAAGLIELGPHGEGRDCEISYQFHTRFWGQGFAREAVGAVMRHALDDAGRHRIVAVAQAANTASRRLLDALGLVEIGRVRRFGAEQVILATR